MTKAEKIWRVGAFALAVLAVQIVLSKIYPLIGKSTTQLFAIEPTTGIGGKMAGDKILGYLTGYIPFDLSSWSTWIAMYIGVFVLIWAGLWLYDTKFIRDNLYVGKNLGGRIFAILLYGHVVLYLVLLLMKFSVPGIAVNLLIGLGVNLILVSLLVALIANKIKFFRI